MTRGSSVFIGSWNLFCTQQWLSAGLNIKTIPGLAWLLLWFDNKISKPKLFILRSVWHICHFGNFKCDQWGAQIFKYKNNCKYKYKIQSFWILSGTSAVHMLHPAAFCHSTMDGIGNDLCNRRRSLFFRQTLSIAQLRSRRAQVFHFGGLHPLLLMDCDRFVLVRHQFRWKACFWPRSLSATGGQSHLIRFGFGGRHKKWRSLSYLKIC